MGSLMQVSALIAIKAILQIIMIHTRVMSEPAYMYVHML